MHTDYSFHKVYIAGEEPAAATGRLMDWLGSLCEQNGLVPTEQEADAHFTYLLIEGGNRWLHFDAMGHFQPQNGGAYLTLVQHLSLRYPTVDFRGSDGGPYVLRRFSAGKVTARYAIHDPAGEYGTKATADPWAPVFTQWQGLLQRDIKPEEFARLLPAPRHPGVTEPREEIDYFDLPEHFVRLFGWHPELNYACIEFAPDGPDGRGDFYEPVAGDYTDTERGLRIYVRHFAHPQPGNRYGEG